MAKRVTRGIEIGWVRLFRLFPLLLGLGASTAGAATSLELQPVYHVAVDAVHLSQSVESAVEVFFRALDENGRPVRDIRAVDVAVRRDGVPLTPESLVSVSGAAEAIACVIVVDTSRTMLGRPFARSRAAALEMYDALGPNDPVAIVTFSDRVRILSDFAAPSQEGRALLAALEPDLEALTSVPFDGLHHSLTGLRDRDGRGLVVLFTHGRDGGSEATLADAEHLAGVAPDRPRLPIFPVVYTGRGGEGVPALEALASASGGRLFDLGDFRDAPRSMLDPLRGGYVARFGTELDGLTHRIAVEVEGVSGDIVTAFPHVLLTERPGPDLEALSPELLRVAAVLLSLATGLRIGRTVRSEDPVAHFDDLTLPGV